MTVLVVPGAFTAPGAFDEVAAALTDALGEAAGPVRVLTLPARAARWAQLDRGGLAAADRLLDHELAHAAGTDGPTVLVGHSLGGLLALRASRRTEVDGLVLLMPAPPGGLAADLLRLLVRDPATAVAFVMLSVSSLPVRRLPLPAPRGLFTTGASREVRERSRSWRVDESWRVLAQLVLGSRDAVAPSGVPTLVVAGRDDGLVPAATVARLAADLDAELLELPVAHNFNEEPAGSVVTDAVVDWLRSLPALRRARVGGSRP